MLDRFPTPIRDLLFVLTPVVLGWAGSTVVPFLSDQHPALSYALAGLVAVLGAWLTPLSRSYGVGAAGGSEGGTASVS